MWRSDAADADRRKTPERIDALEAFYNPIRLHSTLGYRSPVEYEKIMREQKALTTVSPPNPGHPSHQKELRERRKDRRD